MSIDPNYWLNEAAAIDGQQDAPIIKQGSDGQWYRLDVAKDEWYKLKGFPEQEPTPGKGSYFEDDFGNRYYQAPPDIEAGQYGPQRPPQLVWENPNANAIRRQKDLETAYKQRQLENIGAPPQRAARYPEEIALDQLRLRELEQKLAAYPEERDYEREQARLKAELDQQKQLDQIEQWRRQNEQQQEELASSLGNWWTSERTRALPYAVDPSWTTYPGFEAGGPVSRLWEMSGSTGYQPPVIPQQQFNPIANWQAARDAVFGQQQGG